MARAETIWNWTHQASGTGTAHLFDGGPIVIDSDATVGSDDPDVRSIAYDSTGGGVHGALFNTVAWSRIEFDEDGTLALTLQLQVLYASSDFPGGLRPGGEGQGQLSSLIEFVMPADEVFWVYGYHYVQSVGFEGATSLLIEDVTRSEVLAHLTDEEEHFETVLTGRAGDLIRIITESEGSGSVPPNVTAFRRYDALFISTFTVPEPALLAIVLVVLAFRRDRPRFDSVRSHPCN